MNTAPSTERRRPGELDHVMSRLALVSEDLRQSFASLSERAQHVELELSRANDELGRKVEQLDATTRHLEAVLHALPLGVVVRDAEGRVVRTNVAALAILDVDESQLVGRVDAPERLRGKCEGEPFELELADGTKRVIVTRTSPIHDSDGRVKGSVEILDDRTQITRLNARVHRMDKMAALGTMAAGIAHEIRNPLNAIRGFADLLRRRLEPDTREARWGGLIAEGVDDVDAIIKSMLTFAAPNRLELETVCGREIVESAVNHALTTLQEEDADRWSVTWNVTAPSFRADRIKLRQAIRNLVANALEAQPQGGSVAVNMQVEGREVVVTVDDDGPGLAEELKHRVVDPFFTTRPEGTGLGLALVHTIVQLHSGRFEIGARPGCNGGTRAVVRLPISDDSCDS